MEGYVSTGDAANRLEVSTTRVREMITDKVIDGAQKFGRDWWIPEAEVQRLEKADRKPGRPKKEAAKK